MLFRIFRKKPNIYIGDISIIEDGAKFTGFKADKSIENFIIKTLAEYFHPFKAPENICHLDSDLTIDIAVTRMSIGSLGILNAGDFSIPLFNRPKLQIEAQLLKSKNGKFVNNFRIYKVMPFFLFLKLQFNFFRFFSFGNGHDKYDLEYLLIKCSKGLIKKLKKYQ